MPKRGMKWPPDLILKYYSREQGLPVASYWFDYIFLRTLLLCPGNKLRVNTDAMVLRAAFRLLGGLGV